MMTKYVVTNEQKKVFQDRVWELENRWRKDILEPKQTLDGLQSLIENKGVGVSSKAEGDWLEKILARERACHLAFFGQEFDLTDFADTLKKYGESKIKFWQKPEMEPAFLPEVAMPQDANFRGWKLNRKVGCGRKLPRAKFSAISTMLMAKWRLSRKSNSMVSQS